ncbi:MAG: 4Fe-4S dicluster domain-containing protein [Planctomycetes bacterium]|nr:4Fe-4S dicluster domain-containing protein [Planctomycetota bacterium]
MNQRGADACDEIAGRIVPVVDARRCENKGACALVCPYDVFEIRTVEAERLRELGWMTRLKIRFHGGKQAAVARPGECHACGLCAAACPEKAIRLVKVNDPNAGV